jgi:ankyrin repeat protein
MDMLLKHSSVDIEPQDTDGLNPLLYAARYGHTSSINILLNHGADIEAKDRRGRTALFWATKNRHLGAVNLLLERGANPKIKETTERTLVYVLMYLDWEETDVELEILTSIVTQPEHRVNQEFMGLTPILAWAL